MPPYDTSTGLRALQGNGKVRDIDAGFLALAQDVAARFVDDTAAARPAAGIPGRVFRATDIDGVVALDTGAAWISLAPGYGSSLPTSNLYDGQRFILTADGANGVRWEFRYNASGGTYKWELTGGGALVLEGSYANAGAHTSPTDITGVALTVPRAGEYEIDYCARPNLFAGSAGNIFVYPKIGAAAAPGGDVDGVPVSDSLGAWMHRIIKRTAGAGDAVQMQHQTSSTIGTYAIDEIGLRIRPIRVA
jgi:hypothetical protein